MHIRGGSVQLSDGRSLSVAIVHDYLTQRGGAERVALLMNDAFPGATFLTSLYEPGATFPGFRDVDVRVMPINRFRVLRHHHRTALPVLAPSFSAVHVDADITICSSSGWAHGVRCSGKKVVYCYSPARWLYRSEQYLGLPAADLGREDPLGLYARRGASIALRAALRRWDDQAAHSADHYVTVSRSVASLIDDVYGIRADVLPPPSTLDVGGEVAPVPGVEPGYLLCVARLLPYKNVQSVVEAANRMPTARLVVVGDGPSRRQLEAIAGPRVRFLGVIPDSQLRWLYQSCSAVLAASYEDFGLTPIEAATFGRPSVVLRYGGFLDTVVDGTTGLFFESPEPASILEACRRAAETSWDSRQIMRHAREYSKETFIRKLRSLVDGLPEDRSDHVPDAMARRGVGTRVGLPG